MLQDTAIAKSKTSVRNMNYFLITESLLNFFIAFPPPVANKTDYRKWNKSEVKNSGV